MIETSRLLPLRGLGVLLLLIVVFVLFGIIGFALAIVFLALRSRAIARSHEHFVEGEPGPLQLRRFQPDQFHATDLSSSLSARLVLVLTDFVALLSGQYLGPLLVAVVVWIVGGVTVGETLGSLGAHVERAALVVLPVLFALLLFGRYTRLVQRRVRFADVALATSIALTAELLLSVAGMPPHDWRLTAASWIAAGLFLPLSYAGVRVATRVGSIAAACTVWVGKERLVGSLARGDVDSELGRDWWVEPDDASVAGLLAALDDSTIAERVGRIVIALESVSITQGLTLHARLSATGVPTLLCVDLGMAGRFAQGSRLRLDNGVLQIEQGAGDRRWFSSALKRIVDVLGALIGLIILGPVMLVLSVLIRRDGGSAIFRHERIGRGGAPFMCLKLRTMRMNSKAMLERHLANDPTARVEWERDFKLRDDPRVTPLGDFLRRTSLDELPQLINVLRGEMSLVGPRPVVAAELASYYRASAELYRRVRPGVTGPWQISGRNDLSYAERVALDAHYALNWSLFSDVLIILQTMMVPFFKRGAY